VAQGMTTGVKNALSRGSVHSMCKECGFPLPRYPGRYPKDCPSCGGERQVEKADEETSRIGMSAYELVIEDGYVPSVGDTFTVGEQTGTIVEVDEDAAYVEWSDGEVQVFSL